MLPNYEKILLTERSFFSIDKPNNSNSELKEKLTTTEIKVQELEKELAAKPNTPFGEKLEKIIQIDLNALEKELSIPLSEAVIQKIKAATNYQDLSTIRNSEIIKYLKLNKDNLMVMESKRSELVKKQQTERMFWVILLIMCLLTIGGLLVKMKGLSLRRKKVGKN